MSDAEPIIYWFRHDLRLTDLPGLHAALASGRPVLPCYVLDDDSPGERRLGGASRWWLHHSLAALQQDLAEKGAPLLLLHGDTRKLLPELARRVGATDIYCSRGYEPWAAQLEQTLFESLQQDDVTLKRFPGYLLFEPESICNQSDKPFRVFTPFWKHCLKTATPREPSALPSTCNFQEGDSESVTLKALDLLPQNPDWAAGWADLWQPGSAGARNALQGFLADGLNNYRDERDVPGKASTSKLSPHLHFGEISPVQVWHTVKQATAGQAGPESQAQKFLAEVGWREFNTHLLWHFPHIAEGPFNAAFSAFPWQQNAAMLHQWQRGETGYPIVDAGMRELWQTGYMHNRVRMVCASFLTKHLLLHWRHGEQWFWDTLLDADMANNLGGWQWSAGCGADAAPYFRIFNPILQGKKFDGKGEYVRRWIPELAQLPDRYLHEPWAAPAEVLETAAVELGETYPQPIVDHAEARQTALNAYAAMKNDDAG